MADGVIEGQSRGQDWEAKGAVMKEKQHIRGADWKAELR